MAVIVTTNATSFGADWHLVPGPQSLHERACLGSKVPLRGSSAHLAWHYGSLHGVCDLHDDEVSG